MGWIRDMLSKDCAQLGLSLGEGNRRERRPVCDTCAVRAQSQHCSRTQPSTPRACDWVCLGAQGIPTHTLELPQPRDGNRVLEHVVFLEHRIANAASDGCLNLLPEPATHGELGKTQTLAQARSIPLPAPFQHPNFFDTSPQERRKMSA